MGFLDQITSQLKGFDTSKVKDALGGLNLGGGGKGVLGIDIGSSAIKVVQARDDKGTAVLETYGELALGPYANLEIGRATNLDVDRLSEALRDIMREANVTTKNCGVSIPFASSLITLLELPAVDNKTLKTMIPLEARKYIPVPISEVQLDWFVIPEGDTPTESEDMPDEESGQQTPPEKKKTLVLLVAIHNDVLRKFDTVLKGAGLAPSFYEIEIFSSIRAALGRGIAPVVLLDIGAAHSKLYIVEAGIVRISHVINRGAQDITLSTARSSNAPIAQVEELKRAKGLEGNQGDAIEELLMKNARSSMEFIFAEAERAIVAYQRKHNTNLSTVVLTGGGATLKGLLPMAQQKFEREVTLANPFARLQSPAFLDEVLKEAGPEFAVAVGVILRKLQE